MNLLRDNELIYGRLLPVEEPHLIERYNKALDGFGLRPTARTSFEIDRSGFRRRWPRSSATGTISIRTRSTGASSS
jgi:hypothetical protein